MKYATLNGFEVVQIYGSSELTTTQDIANLGSKAAGSGITSQKTISTGSTTTQALLNSFNAWNSMTAATKRQPIPTSTGSLAMIIVADIAGTASQYPINIVPLTGKILGASQVFRDGDSITLLDTSFGWVSI